MNKLLQEMIHVPGFFNYKLTGRGLEIKPGHYSPIYISMKALWNCPAINKAVSTKLLDLVDKDTDTIIGIESGGSPYAVFLADHLNSSLVLARKESKVNSGFLTSTINESNSKVIIIDDIIATAASASKTIAVVKEKTSMINLVCILSYGMDDYIKSKYGVNMISMFSIDELVSNLPHDLSIKVYPHILEYKNKLIKTFI